MSDPDSTAILRRAKFIVGCLLSVLLIGAVIVVIMRSFQASALEASTNLHAKHYVATISPKANADGQPLTLPGTLLGVIEATVYARSNGYVVRWVKDIGSSVKKGELLAEIAAPEIDQELTQAESARAQVAASVALAKSTADRWQALRQKDAVTQQDLDERQSAYNQAAANLAAADANVGRLKKLQGFNQVVAPFDGVVTRRNIDVGDLVNAGNGGTGQALFAVAQVDPLRLYVYVPQAYASQIKIGDAVTIGLAGRVNEQYQGSGGAHRACHRYGDTHHASRNTGAEPHGRIDRGFVRAGDAAARRRCQSAGGSHQCAVVSAGGHARRARWTPAAVCT